MRGRSSSGFIPGGGGGGPLAGDVTGAPGSNIIQALQSVPFGILPGSSVLNDVIAYNGTQYKNEPFTNIFNAQSMGGDCFGNPSANAVGAIQNISCQSGVPANGDTWVYNAGVSQWQHAPGGGGGGVSGFGSALYVDANNGNDGTAARGDFALRWLTLDQAILAANIGGDCIEVGPGAYGRSAFKLSGTVSLRGRGAGITTITGSAVPAIDVDVNSTVTIEDCTIADGGAAAFAIDTGAIVRFKNCHIQSSSFVSLATQANVTFENCTRSGDFTFADCNVTHTGNAMPLVASPLNDTYSGAPGSGAAFLMESGKYRSVTVTGEVVGYAGALVSADVFDSSACTTGSDITYYGVAGNVSLSDASVSNINLARIGTLTTVAVAGGPSSVSAVGTTIGGAITLCVKCDLILLNGSYDKSLVTLGFDATITLGAQLDQGGGSHIWVDANTGEDIGARRGALGAPAQTFLQASVLASPSDTIHLLSPLGEVMNFTGTGGITLAIVGESPANGGYTVWDGGSSTALMSDAQLDIQGVEFRGNGTDPLFLTGTGSDPMSLRNVFLNDVANSQAGNITGYELTATNVDANGVLILSDCQTTFFDGAFKSAASGIFVKATGSGTSTFKAVGGSLGNFRAEDFVRVELRDSTMLSLDMDPLDVATGNLQATGITVLGAADVIQTNAKIRLNDCTFDGVFSALSSSDPTPIDCRGSTFLSTINIDAGVTLDLSGCVYDPVVITLGAGASYYDLFNARIATNQTGATIQATPRDAFILSNNNAGPSTVTMSPAGKSAGMIVIQPTKMTVVDTLTIAAGPGDTIDGAATQVISVANTDPVTYIADNLNAMWIRVT